MICNKKGGIIVNGRQREALPRAGKALARSFVRSLSFSRSPFARRASLLSDGKKPPSETFALTRDRVLSLRRESSPVAPRATCILRSSSSRAGEVNSLTHSLSCNDNCSGNYSVILRAVHRRSSLSFVNATVGRKVRRNWQSVCWVTTE